MAGALKCTQDVTYIQIGDPTSKKLCTAPATQDIQRLGHVTPLPISICGITPPSHHRPVDNYQRRSTTLMKLTESVGKPSQDWSSDSTCEAEYAPLGFEQHPSNPYYTSAGHDDPYLSIHAQGESFEDDGDSAFTPKQISVMKATMRDIL